MIHATSNQPADPTCREISALTIKMPEPTMMPETIITESNSPSALRNSPVCAAPACDSKPCTSALNLLPPALCKLCHYLKATSAARHNHRCVTMRPTKPTCFSVHRDTGHALALRRPEADVQLLRLLTRRRQRHRRNQLIPARLQSVAHVAVACRGLLNRNRLPGRHPIARNGAPKVQSVLIVILKDQHPPYQQRNRLLCGNTEDGAAARNARNLARRPASARVVVITMRIHEEDV